MLARIFSKILRESYSNEELLGWIHSHQDTMRTMFSDTYSRPFSSASGMYGTRGGEPYFKPCYWVRISLCVENFEMYKHWCIAYHGTIGKSAIPILLCGLQKPGKCGVKMVHGDVFGKNIYTSPSIEYAGHPVYSQLIQLGTEHWAQIVLQCRVRPGSFRKRNSTLGRSYWPQDLRFDPNFPTHDKLEWVVKNPEDVVVTAVMMREFGPSVDVGSYGPLVAQVRSDGHPHGPEYHWIQIRAHDYRIQNWLISSSTQIS